MNLTEIFKYISMILKNPRLLKLKTTEYIQFYDDYEEEYEKVIIVFGLKPNPNSQTAKECVLALSEVLKEGKGSMEVDEYGRNIYTIWVKQGKEEEKTVNE